MIKKLLKLLYLLAAVCIIGIAATITVAQSSWFKSKLEEKLHELAALNGFSLSFGELKGSIPLRWDIKNLSLICPDGTTIQIDLLRIRIAFFPFIRKELGIGFLKAGEVHVNIHGISKDPIEEKLFNIINTFPLDLSIRSLRIDKMFWQNEQFSIPPFQIKGMFKIKKAARDLFIKLMASTLEEGFEQEIFAIGGSRKGQLELRVKNRLDLVKTTNSAPFSEIKSLSQFDLRGPWSSWRAIAMKQSADEAPLSGEFFARIDHLKIPDYPFLNQPWKLRASFAICSNRSIDIKKSSIRGALGELYVQGLLRSDLIFSQGEYSLTIPSLAPFSTASSRSLEGSLQATGLLEANNFNSNFIIEQGKIGPLHFGLMRSSLQLSRTEKLWEGSLQFGVDEQTIHLEGDSRLSVDSEKGFFLKNLAIRAPSLHAGGDLFIDKTHFYIDGALRLQADDLSALDPLFPDSALGGRVGAELYFLNSGGQSAKAYATLSNIEMRHLKIADGTVSLDLQHVDGNLAGLLDLHTERVYLPNVYFASLDIHSQGENALWNFEIDSKGTWKEPFRLFAKGSLSDEISQKKIVFEELDGTFLSHELKLKDKASLEFSEQALCLEASSIRLGGGELAALYSFNQGEWQFSLQGNEVPLAWLTLFTPYLSLQGESSITCALHGNRDSVRGSCQLLLKEMMAKRFGSQPIFQAKGALFSSFEGKKMQLQSEVNAIGGQVVLLDASLPLRFDSSSYFPLRLDVEDLFSGTLLIEGKLEEFSEFINTGFHRWRGWLEGKVLFSGALSNPQMQGNLAIHQGAYENDFLGLRLENLEASIHALHDELILTSLKATGLKRKGHIESTGNMRLQPQDHFPYLFSAKIEQLPTINLDLVEAVLTGSVEIEGDSQKAIARGNAAIDEAMFSIPRTLPADIPDLPVTYIHQPAHVETQIENAPVSFPFSYDLSFHAKDTIHFDAGGLTSRWGGDLHLHGVNLSMLASGNLRLIKGHFSLLGKTFQLNQGEISFSDRPGEEGLLNISGTLNMSDVTITAQLRGTLSEPQLSLQSVPPLTTTDIFSLLLFNKKITEIKPMQAVQLARTVMSFSGNSGWNFVGQIGGGLNVLGIDTFDIIPSEHGLDQTSITIGKQLYLIRGVLVSLTQSLSSSRFTVEVDLGGGLLFQAENESSESQSGQVGKLSLKWNKNY